MRDQFKRLPLVLSLVREGRKLSWKLWEKVNRLLHGKAYQQTVFTNIYRSNYWQDPESKSGKGSNQERTEVIRRELPRVMRELGARSLLDAPCGDFQWMQHIVGQFNAYIGVDVVAEMIERNQADHATDCVQFLVADLTATPLPRADAILCRDCLIHLSSAFILAAFRNFRRSGADFLMLTNDRYVNEYHDIVTGSWRPLNFLIAPFNFPPPMRVIVEAEAAGRELCIWRMSDLPSLHCL